MAPHNRKTSPTLRSAISASLVQQALVLVISGMALDGGLIAQVCLFGAAAFWTGVLCMLVRRRMSPTKMDLALVRYGYPLACITSLIVAGFVWKLRGW